MKSTYYSLAVVVLVLLGLGVAFLNQPAQGVKSEAPAQREVYVDVARLIALHPGSRAAEAMRAVVADVERSSRSIDLKEYQPLFAKAADSEPPRTVDVARHELEAEIAQMAVSALSRLESEQRQALQARVRASQNTLMQSAELDMASQIRDIRNEASERERKATQSLYASRLSAELALGALTVSEKSQWHSATQQGATAADMRMELGRITAAMSAANSAIEKEQQEQIAQLRLDSAGKIRSDLSVYEAEEQRKIEESIADARNEILRELSLFDAFQEGDAAHGLGLSVSRGRVVVTPVVDTAEAKASGGDLASVSTMIARLESRVRLDVGAAVKELAEQKGVKVTFTRSSARRGGVPDRTSAFAEMMRSRDFDAWGPVLSLSGRG